MKAYAWLNLKTLQIVWRRTKRKRTGQLLIGEADGK